MPLLLCSKSGNAMSWRAQTMEMPVFGVHLQFAKPVNPGPEIAVQANTATYIELCNPSILRLTDNFSGFQTISM